MATTLLKPRWTAWENSCVQKAFKQNIQHKIMAIALGRTLPAINKKIKMLGLRMPSSLSGRLKKSKQPLSKHEKLPHDLLKMKKILKEYAPIEFFEKSEFVLNTRAWTESKADYFYVKKTKKPIDKLNFSEASFTFVKSMSFIPTKASYPFQKGEKKYVGDPLYVSLQYVEHWAALKGFHKLKGNLVNNGFSYWSKGNYFSKAQLLMFVNRFRYERNLQPLALEEDEID